MNCRAPIFILLTIICFSCSKKTSTAVVPIIPPVIQPLSFHSIFNKLYGGTNDDDFTNSISTSDGDFVVLGITKSTDGDIKSINHGQADLLLAKLDSSGKILWQKTLGGTDDEIPVDIKLTSDGGFIITASAGSNNGDLTTNAGSLDCWIIKTNSAGDIIWQKTFGGSQLDFAGPVSLSNDGGFLLAGNVTSNDGDALGNHAISGVLLIKLNTSGNVVWKKIMSGTKTEKLTSILTNSDGSYILCGNSTSTDGDFVASHGGEDIIVAKIDGNGNVLWQKSYGGSKNDFSNTILSASDGGYLITGYTNSNDGQVSGNHGNDDVWIFKINSTGDLEWQKAFGGSAMDRGLSSISSSKGDGYFIVGQASSTDGNVTVQKGIVDAWIIKIDLTGNILWQKTQGGNQDEYGESIISIPGNNYIVAGSSRSNSGDFTGSHGLSDGLIMRFNEE
jgi:hypothetical protein